MNSSAIARLSAKRILLSQQQPRSALSLMTTAHRVNYNRTLVVANRTPLLFSQQSVRMVASAKKADCPGYLDNLVGVYEDPNYQLDVKVEEWREGQWFYFFSDFGVWILLVPTCLAIAACFASLMWYTFFDPQVQIMRSNPNPEMGIRSGRDLDKVRSPLLAWQYEFGMHHDRKMHFYYEIQDAIERKKQLNK